MSKSNFKRALSFLFAMILLVTNVLGAPVRAVEDQTIEAEQKVEESSKELKEDIEKKDIDEADLPVEEEKAEIEEATTKEVEAKDQVEANEQDDTKEAVEIKEEAETKEAADTKVDVDTKEEAYTDEATDTSETKDQANTKVEDSKVNLSTVKNVEVASDEETVDFYFEPTALQVAYKNAIFVNGEFFAFIEDAAAHTVQIPKSLLNDGQNTITFICGSQELGSYYDETVAPETRNHNDPKVKNLLITKDGMEYAPESLEKYFITDQTILAIESHTTEKADYAKNTDYKFGDGGPNGSPHPASLTIPYKIDFAFDFSKEGTPVKDENENTIIKQVNAHVGPVASTDKNISWVTVENSVVDIKVYDKDGNTVFSDKVEGNSNGNVYTYTSEVRDLKAGSKYSYVLENSSNKVEGEFTTAVAKNSNEKIRFGMIADPQVANVENGNAAGAVFNQLNQYAKHSPLDFLYIAGDHTDRADDESQWQAFFHPEGMFPNSTQDFLLKNTIHSTQGNHDTADFKGHINTPDEIGENEFQKGVYAVDYGKVKFITINNASYNVAGLASNPDFQSMVEFLKAEVKDAKENDMWTVLVFHKPLYTGASHVDDNDVIEYRKVLNPIITDLDIDFVLNGHDHVYSRGFVNKDGNNVTKLDKEAMANNGGVTTFANISNAPLHLVAEHAGSLKWYSPVDYVVGEGDPIAANYEFLDKNSTTENPSSQELKEQTYMVIEIDENQANFVAYKMKYENGQIVNSPRVYDEFYVTKANVDSPDEPGDDNETPEDPTDPVEEIPEDLEPGQAWWDVVNGKVYNGNQIFRSNVGDSDSKVEFKIDETVFTGESSGQALFNYESSGIQANDGQKFKNGFAINGENVDYLNESIPSIKIDESKLKYGQENTISLSIGTADGPYDENLMPGAKNHDDFKVSNFNIELPNGTVIKPRVVKTYNAVDRNTPASEKNIVSEEAYSDSRTFDLGDGFPGGSNLDMYYKIDLVFNLPEQDKTISYYNVDTTKFADGDHKALLILDGKVVEEANIIFDNSAPEITTNILDEMQDGTELQVDVTDKYSDVKETLVKLNGEEIKLPYKLDVNKLGQDLQFINITVTDSLGNTKTEHFTFKISANESSLIKEASSSQEGCDYNFTVDLSDSVSGKVDVKLYKAEAIDYTSFTGSSANIAKKS